MRKIANLGIILFCIFYLIAAGMYNGGNAWDHECVQFSWLRNYWCDFTTEYNFRRLPNVSRYYAYTAMFFVILSFVIIWFRLPIILGYSRMLKTAKYTGIASIVLASTVITSLHEFAIYSGGTLAMFSFILLLFQLLKIKDMSRFLIGIFAISSMIWCIIIYYFKIGIVLLPVSQKICMVLILIWFFMLNNKPIIRVLK